MSVLDLRSGPWIENRDQPIMYALVIPDLSGWLNYAAGDLTLHTDLNRSGEISRTLRQLHKLTALYVLNSTCYWHQRFERAISWGMVTWCSLSRQKFNTTKWVWFQIPSHTSSLEYRGNKKITSSRWFSGQFFFSPLMKSWLRPWSGIKPIWWYSITVLRDYSTLPYLTIWHAQTVGISDLCCL